MAKGLFKRIGGHAVPADPAGTDALFAVKDGGVFTADIGAVKNQEQVNLFFALRDLVCEATNSAREPTKEWLLSRTGFVYPVFYPDGSMQIKPKSIRKMQQAEFDQFFQTAIPIVQEELQTSRAELLARFFDLLDPNTRAAFRKRLNRMKSPPIAPEGGEERERVDA